VASQGDIEHLLVRWKEKVGARFIPDGIVAHEDWQAAERKILYLMKEPNGFDDPGGWSLCDFLHRGGVGGPDNRSYTATTGLTARWSSGLTGGFLSWRETCKNNFSDPTVRQRFLRKVAVANIKKTGGASSTRPGSLVPVAAEYQDLLREQIRLICPTLIVCCGTGREFHGILYPELARKEASNGVKWFHHKGERWKAVDYYHPQARYPHYFLYTMLVTAVREILGED
jgi:hypothetical protein